MKKNIIIVLLAMVFLNGCAANSWVTYTQTHFQLPVNDSEGKLLYYKQNVLESNPRWIKDINACLKYGHEVRGLNYSENMWKTEEMCYKHEDCIKAVYNCLEQRGYIRIP